MLDANRGYSLAMIYPLYQRVKELVTDGPLYVSLLLYEDRVLQWSPCHGTATAEKRIAQVAAGLEFLHEIGGFPSKRSWFMVATAKTMWDSFDATKTPCL